MTKHRKLCTSTLTSVYRPLRTAICAVSGFPTHDDETFKALNLDRILCFAPACSHSGRWPSEATEEEGKSVTNEPPPPPRSFDILAWICADMKCPMKSFHIPMSRMSLSEEALKMALEIDSIRDAQDFLDTFGSHVSNGRQEVQYSVLKRKACSKKKRTSTVCGTCSLCRHLAIQIDSHHIRRRPYHTGCAVCCAS